MKTPEELQTENETLQRQITGQKPVPHHLVERVKELKAAGLSHNDALDCAARQCVEDAHQAEAGKCKQSAERQALLEIQVAARSLLNMVESAIGRGGNNA